THSTGEQKALRGMSFLRWHQDLHEEAVAINEALVALDRQRGDTNALVTDLLTLLTVLTQLQDFDRELVCVEELLILDRQLEDPVRQLPTYSNLSEFFRDLGDHTRALFYCDRAIGLVEQNPHLGAQTYQLAMRALILLEQGRAEESIECYKNAVGMERSGRAMIGAGGPAHIGLASLLRRLGEVLVALQRDEEALPYLEEAVSFAVESEDAETEALLRRRVAIIHEGGGRAAATRVAWEQVRALCHRHADFGGESEALGGLGRLAHRVGDLDQALRLNREALRLAEQAGWTTKQGELHNALGIIAWKR